LKRHFVNRTGTVSADFARKLERERDKAREDAKRATYDAAKETIKVSTVKSHWIEACRERDEARTTVLRLRKQRAIARNFGRQMERERNEARKLLAAAQESLNAIHVEVGGWIGSMMKGGK
jgi:hypothetical protein